MVSNLYRSQNDLIAAYDTTLEGWVKALDLRDHETTDHSTRVAKMTIELARRLGIDVDNLEDIRRGALLHDIGKMAVPDSILLKEGPLTPAEWQIMQQHPTYAFQMLQQIPFLEPALAIPHCHHEKWNGSGYPQGLRGETIPITARIFAIVDAWDSLTSDRPYRKAVSPKQARQALLKDSRTHFDPGILATFFVMLDDMER